MATVFLSYSRDDSARVRLLAGALERAGHTVWWDKHIPGGDEYAKAIEKALDTADAVVVAWSRSAVQSAWVRDEAAAGRDSGRLVPLTLDGCPPPLGFRQYQTIDLSSWTGRPGAAQLATLADAVAARTDRDRAPDAKPQRAKIGLAPDRKRWFAAAAAAVLLIAGAGLFYPRVGLLAGSGSLAPRVSLARFELSSGLSGDLARAMNEEILAAFGAENAVAVTTAGISGSKSAPFVLGGSIRKIDEALRFTVNLKDSRSGMVVWSQAFDRAAADPLAPRQVSVAASQVVRCGLWGASSYPRRMPDQALSLYLQFCNELWGGSADEQRIFDAAKRVTTAVPDFSFGWSSLALAAVPLSHRAGSIDSDQLREQASEAAQKSIRLDRLNPEGYMAMAGLLPLDRYAEREQLLRKAISVRPTECGCERMAYGDFLTSVGRVEEAVEQYERARAMMPLAPFTNVRLAQALFVVGRHQDAERILGQTIEIWPDAATLRLLKLKSAYWTGRYDEAIPILRGTGLHLTDGQRDALEVTFQALASNDPASRERAASALQEMASNPRRNDRLIVAGLAALDADGAALQAARNLIRERGPPLADVLFEPNLAEASATPNYAALVRQLGLAGYWQSTRQIPDICRQSRQPTFCTGA
ncbi:MAG TPA: TIR domain-containing protein [Sphingomicrobium sp.]|nr:TIR domain-containing protein [Sphingomicrobium sp.]